MLGDDGKTVNQKMTSLMWEDVRERLKQLGVSLSVIFMNLMISFEFFIQKLDLLSTALNHFIVFIFMGVSDDAT